MKKIISLLLFSSILSFQIFGADTTKIDPGVPINVTVGGICKTITNTGSNSIFAPSGNANDFAAFNAHLPAGMSSVDCVVIPNTNCAGTWGTCIGACGTTGSQTFAVSTPASGAGTACPLSPQSCTMPACGINGLCGTASTRSFSTPPASGLCSAGVASVVSGSNPYTWMCNGTGGGTSVNCTTLCNLQPVATAYNCPPTYAYSSRGGTRYAPLNMNIGPRITQPYSVVAGMCCYIFVSNNAQCQWSMPYPVVNKCI